MKTKGYVAKWAGLAVIAAIAVGGCHEQKLATAEVASKPAAPSPFGSGYVTGILQSPTMHWPQGSIADIVLTSSLPIEVVDAPAGTLVEQGRTVLTYMVQGVGREMKVTANDVELDRFALDAAKLQADQTVELAEQTVTAAREDLEAAKSGGGLYGVGESKRALAQAERALARAREQSESAVAAAQAKVDREKPLLAVGDRATTVSELRAPITGTVAWLNAKGGKSAGKPGTVVGEIVDTTAVRIQAEYSDRYGAVVRAGTPVKVLFADKSDWPVPGEVVQTEQTSTINGNSENVATIKLVDQARIARPTSQITGIAVQE